MIFALANILISVEIGVLYGELLHFNPQQIGLQNVAMIIGSLIGELIGGLLSDYWMLLKKKRTGKDAEPEFRLWLSYIAYPLAIIGVAIFLAFIANIADGGWSVTPDIGVAIAAAGNQVATTVLITYSIDCYHTEAASIGTFINFVRQVWGFIGPFW